MSDSFSAERYPSVEETLRNNASSLYKQKRQFLNDLRTLMGTSGYALIGMLYLRDVSTFKFVWRSVIQFFISSPFAAQLQYMGQMSEESRKEQSWFLFWSVIMVNCYSLISHVLFALPKIDSYSDGQLHGGLSIQFIGERLPKGKLELVLFDGILFILQLLYFCLMCTTDDSAVLSSISVSLDPSEEAVSSDVVSDGYDGNVGLITIDLYESVKSSYIRQQRPVVAGENGNVLETYRQRALRQMNV